MREQDERFERSDSSKLIDAKIDALDDWRGETSPGSGTHPAADPDVIEEGKVERGPCGNTPG